MMCSRSLHSAAAFRMILTPIDTFKTTMQAQGARGTALLRKRVKENGVGSLWWGAFATAAATFVGHYPWFATVSSIHAFWLTLSTMFKPCLRCFCFRRSVVFLGVRLTDDFSTTSSPRPSSSRPSTPSSCGSPAWPSSASAPRSCLILCPTRCASSRRTVR